MTLTGADGARFVLEIAGYENPQEDDPYDANWLLIDVEAAVGGRAWRVRDACLFTWEAADLADWLATLADGGGVEAELSFLEPDLRFEMTDRREGLVGVRVWFESEARPSWAPCDGSDMGDLWIDLHATPDQLRSAALSLREGLARYPYRQR